MKKLLFLVLLVGCGGSDDGVANKGITNVWTLEDDSFVFDLSSETLPISAGSMEFVFSGGERCLCTVDVTGTESSGTYVLSGCTYTSGGGGDPGCGSIDSSGTYSASGANMQLCDGGGCATYK